MSNESGTADDEGEEDRDQSRRRNLDSSKESGIEGIEEETEYNTEEEEMALKKKGIIKSDNEWIHMGRDRYVPIEGSFIFLSDNILDLEII